MTNDSFHVYDNDIHEYDNPIPVWFAWLFYLTILWAIGYATYFLVGPGKHLSDALDQEMQAAKFAQTAQAPAQGPSDDELNAKIKDANVQAQGKTVFAQKCVSCHGAKGQGAIGPNLTDEYWIHGGSPSQIFKVITEGVSANGMPPWGPIIVESERVALVAFIKNLPHVAPPEGKAPQGQPAGK